MGRMTTPVVVASVFSATRAELLAGHLRGQGITAYAMANLDRSAYGAGMGGASVFVDRSERLEAELELLLLDELHRGGADTGEPGRPEAGPNGGRRRPRWVRLASWVALSALAVGAVVPTVAAVARLAG